MTGSVWRYVFEDLLVHIILYAFWIVYTLQNQNLVVAIFFLLQILLPFFNSKMAILYGDRQIKFTTIKII